MDITRAALDLDLLDSLLVDAKDSRIEVASSAFIDQISSRRIGNLTKGLVPVSQMFAWFFQIQGKPVPKDFPRAQAKIAPAWGYWAKREVGLFSDGMGVGHGWFSAPAMAAGMNPALAQRNVAILSRIEGLLKALRPPRYPFSINERKAAYGRTLFDRHCARCHGRYPNKTPRILATPPKMIPWRIVRTDPDLLDAGSPKLRRLIRTSPMRQLTRIARPAVGYYAPRLDGIWARFPYLHNASVPTLWHLLNPTKRPAAFSVTDAGEEYRFDKRRVGLTVPNDADAVVKLNARGQAGDRSVYFVDRSGHSNQGHDFYSGIRDAEKWALIEYLKTL